MAYTVVGALVAAEPALEVEVHRTGLPRQWLEEVAAAPYQVRVASWVTVLLLPTMLWGWLSRCSLPGLVERLGLGLRWNAARARARRESIVLRGSWVECESLSTPSYTRSQSIPSSALRCCVAARAYRALHTGATAASLHRPHGPPERTGSSSKFLMEP